MSWVTLGEQLYNLINDNKTDLKIQEVNSYPTLKFDGFPAVSIFPSDNKNDYETTSDNERIYVWKLRIFEETKGQGLNQAQDTLYEVLDNVLDKLDQEGELDSGQTIGQDLPARYQYINLFATPSFWGQIEDENLIFTEMGVRIRVSVDVT